MMVRKRLVTEAKPNGSVYATPFHKVYVSNTLGKAVTVVDTDKDEVIKTLRFDSEMGMPQYDPVAKKNELMTVFNLDTHQPISFLQMAGGLDVIKFDPGLKRIYAACSSGAISVFQMDDPDHYRVYAPGQEADGNEVARIVIYEAVVNP